MPKLPSRDELQALIDRLIGSQRTAERHPTHRVDLTPVRLVQFPGSFYPSGKSPEEIRADESRGQATLVGNDTLPALMEGNTQAVLEQAGVVFGPLADDPMFRRVQLPEGWYKESTSHAMWSNLKDAKRRTRAELFYKAAHYDRRAFTRAVRRFYVRQDYDHQEADTALVYIVLDCDQEVYRTPVYRFSDERYAGEEYRKQSAAALKDAQDWLESRYPDWEHEGAYWD